MQSTITNLNQRVGEHLKHVTIYTACRISRIIFFPLKQSILQTLLQLAIQGKGAMIARGGCDECSDELLTETIKFMLPMNGFNKD